MATWSTQGLKYSLVGCTSLLMVLGFMGIVLGSLIDTSGPNSAALKICIYVILTGILITVIALLGCISTFQESMAMLSMFPCFLIVLVMTQLITTIGLAVSGNIFNLKRDLKISMSKYTTDDNTAKYWDDLQQNDKCCGLNDQNDWQKYNEPIPMSCCSLPTSKTMVDGNKCNLLGSYFKNGCYEYAYKKLANAVHTLVGFGITVCLVEAVAAMLAIMLLYTMKKENPNGAPI